MNTVAYFAQKEDILSYFSDSCFLSMCVLLFHKIDYYCLSGCIIGMTFYITFRISDIILF